MNSHLLKLFDLSFDYGVELMVSLASPTTSYRFFFESVLFDSLCFFKWIVISLHCSFSVSTMVSSMWFSWLRQQRLLVIFFYFLLLTLFVLWSKPVSIMASSLCFYWLHQNVISYSFSVFFGFCLCFFFEWIVICLNCLTSVSIVASNLWFLWPRQQRLIVFFFESVLFYSLCFFKWIVISLHCSFSVSTMVSSMWFSWLRQQRLLVFFLLFAFDSVCSLIEPRFDHGVKLMLLLASPKTSSRTVFQYFLVFASVFFNE